MKKLDRLVFVHLNRCENSETLKEKYITMRKNDVEVDQQISNFRKQVDDFVRDLLIESCCDNPEDVWKLYKKLLQQAMEEVEDLQSFPDIEMENLIEALYPENVLGWFTESMQKTEELIRTVKYLDKSLQEAQVEKSFWAELQEELNRQKTKEKETVRHQRQFLRIMGDLFWTIDEVNRMPLIQ